MILIIDLDEILQQQRPLVGGKAMALAALLRNGFAVPPGICLTSEAYRCFVCETGLKERIMVELQRKDLADMRWEEMWDCSLRIRNMFLRTPFPEKLRSELAVTLSRVFGRRAVAVRSSSGAEDGREFSFAGRHESFVNVRGTARILDHIRLVWASLWSDAALLYRQDMGLDFANSAMPVIVQEFVNGTCSGVIFSRDPLDPGQAVLEAVPGLNQGLVEGTVGADRWILDRVSGQVVSFDPGQRERIVRAGKEGVVFGKPPRLRPEQAILKANEVAGLWSLSQRLEGFFGEPQDIEWTYDGQQRFVLQSRPITGRSGTEPDERLQYLNLRRSFENLKTLKEHIEQNLVPAMTQAADHMGQVSLQSLSDQELAEEIASRGEIFQNWEKVYWDKFIPFAHGVRLFGQVYNDRLRPQNSYEFVDLLRDEHMASLSRNRAIQGLVDELLREPDLLEDLKENAVHARPEVLTRLHDFLARHASSLSGFSQGEENLLSLIRVVLQMAALPQQRVTLRSKKKALRLKQDFLKKFPLAKRCFAEDLLELARASYRMRDDDNLYLGRIEHHCALAVQEACRRISRTRGIPPVALSARDVIGPLLDPRQPLPQRTAVDHVPKSAGLRARQLVGQPAGEGVAQAKAQVVYSDKDILQFESGNILICDSIDPRMTFIVPLAKAIVERRGGMLIHGAIIAREYGIPCVTGVAAATELIHSGDLLTVDGCLGVVVIHKN